MLQRIIREFKLSIKRNPGKIVKLCLVLLLSSTLLFSTFLLSSGLNTSINEMNEHSLRNVKYYYIDETLVSKQLMDLSDGSPIISSEMAIKLLENVNYGGVSRTVFDSLALEGEQNDFDRYNYKIEDLGLFPNHYQMQLSSVYGIHNIIPTFAAYIDEKEYERDLEIETKHVSIIEGRYLKESDKKKILIHQDFAKENNLSVGNKMKLQRYKDPQDYEIIGIYNVDLDYIHKENIFIDPETGFNLMFEESLSRPALSLGTGDIMIFESVEEATISIEIINRILANDLNYNNIEARNTLEENKEFTNMLVLYKYITYGVAMLIVILTVYLIFKIIKKDLVDYQEDAFLSIYEEDKVVVKRSNQLQVVLISIISLLIASFTAPVLNDVLIKPILIEQTPIPELYPITVNEMQDLINDYNGDPQMHFSNMFELYTIVGMDFNQTILSVSITSLLIILSAYIAVELAQKKIKHRKEI